MLILGPDDRLMGLGNSVDDRVGRGKPARLTNRPDSSSVGVPSKRGVNAFKITAKFAQVADGDELDPIAVSDYVVWSIGCGSAVLGQSVV
jgi:hypothetical protein